MEFLFYLPGILFFISGIPQLIKLLKTKSSDDISIWMYILTMTAIAIIIVDSYLGGNTSVMVSNSVSFVMAGANLFLIVKYRHNKKETL